MSSLIHTLLMNFCSSISWHFKTIFQETTFTDYLEFCLKTGFLTHFIKKFSSWQLEFIVHKNFEFDHYLTVTSSTYIFFELKSFLGMCSNIRILNAIKENFAIQVDRVNNHNSSLKLALCGVALSWSRITNLFKCLVSLNDQLPSVCLKSFTISDIINYLTWVGIYK